MEINIWHILAGLFYLGYGWDYAYTSLEESGYKYKRWEIIIGMFAWPIITFFRVILIIIVGLKP